jgi:type VI secretion system protein ImpC
MPSKWNLGVGGINLTAGGDAADAEEVPEGLPFRLLVCGDFGGMSGKRVPLENRKPLVVDRDNFEDVLAKFAPEVRLPWDGAAEGLTIAFREIEDFEPDRLLSQLSVFDELRTLLRQLGQPATFEEAAQKIRSWTNAPKETAAAPAPAAPARSASAADLLDEVLAEQRGPSGEPSAKDEWEHFLAKIVQPHLVERPNPHQRDYEEVVEEAISVRLRTILHHPAFQALERAWRSLHLLVRKIDTEENLKIYLFDLPAADVEADLARDDPRQAVFFREVVEKTIGTAGGQPWAAIVSLETFGNTPGDLERLGKMLTIAALARTPLLAGAALRLAGCTSLVQQPDPDTWQPSAKLAEAWKVVRSLSEARFLGLVAPRFLARLPYGKGAAKVERFKFEELPGGSSHEHYLWAPGSVVAALLLAEGFADAGWRMDPQEHRKLSGLPVHVYEDEDGERAMKPCAEVLLREDAFERLVDTGLMVLISVRERDAVQLARFQSATADPSPLGGRWSG